MPTRRVSFDIFANDQVSRTFEKIALNTSQLKRKLDAIAAKAVSLKIDADDKDARAKMLAVQAKLADLGKKAARPNIDVVGLAKAEAELAALDVQLDKFGKKKVTASASVDSKGAAGLTRALDGLLALAPTAAPVLGSLAGGAAAVGTAFAGAGAGIGAFAAIALPVVKQLSKDSTSLEKAQTGVNKARAQGTSQSVINAQNALAKAQTSAATATTASVGPSIALQRAQLNLSYAQGRLAKATPKNRASLLHAEQSAELSLAAAQQSSAKKSATSANTKASADARVKAAQDRLNQAVANSPLNKALDKQRGILDQMSPAEQKAADSLQHFKDQWKDLQKDFQPLVFADLGKGFTLARQGMVLLAPIARTVGMELGNLETSASKALNQPFWREFFSYLSGRAGRDVATFGHVLGNLATGFAGLYRAFDPLTSQFEHGLEGLSQKFAAFGKTAGSNTGLQKFIQYVQQEGPQVIHLIGQIATTFGDVAKAAAPLGAVELRIVGETLQLLDAAAKAHPKLVEIGIALYTIGKAASALKLAGAVSAIGGFAGGLRGVESAAGGATSKAGKIGGLFSKVGGIFGATGLAAGALGLGVTAAAVGVGLLTYKLLTAKSANQQYYDSLQKQFGAYGNNEKAYQTLAAQAENQARASARESGLVKNATKNYAAYQKVTGQFALTQAQLGTLNQQAGDQQNKNTYANKKAIETYGNLVKNGNAVAKVTGLTRIQSEALAWSVGVDLTQKVGTSTKAQAAWQKQLIKVRDAQIASRDALLGSLNPSDRVAAATEILGDKHATAAEKIQAVNSELQDEATSESNLATSSASVGDALSNLSGVLGRNTSAAGKAAAVHQILTGNLDTAGPKTRKLAQDLGQVSSAFKTEIGDLYNSTAASKGQAAAADAVAKKHQSMVGALEKTLEKMGLNAHQAHELAVRYLAVPKNISTTASLLKAHDVENAADKIKSKIHAIPTTHSTTTSAKIAAAQKNLNTLERQIKNFPPKAKVEAQAAITQAQRDLDTLESHIYELTHKKWSVRIDANGNVHVPSLAHGPVATPGAATGGAVVGPGGPRDDKVLMWGSNGEFMQQSSAVQREGIPAMQALNDGQATIVPLHRAAGGLITINAHTDAAQLTPFVDGLASSLAKAQQYAKTHPDAASGGTGDMSAHSASAAAAQSYARSILGQFGWGAGQMGSLISLWNGESGWNNMAANPTSTAFGIAQFLNSTWAGKRFPKTTNFMQQIYDGLQYIKGSYGSPSAAFSAWSGRSPHWYGKGTSPGGEIFSKPTLIGVGDGGPEHVSVTPLKGYASGGKVIPNTTFKTGQGFAAAGNHLIDVILSSLTAGRSRSQIDQVTNSIIHSIDADFTGHARSGLVSYTEKVNGQMSKLATARDRIANKLAAANELSTSVISGAKSAADISQFTALGSNNLLKEFSSKLASINRFSANIATMKRHGFSSELIAELLAAGIDQSAPIAAQLAKARPSQVHKFNATQRAVDRASKKLGTVAVNAQFGNSAAHSFVAELNRQQNSLERQMRSLAKVFAKGVGRAFHLRGYATGGFPKGLAVTGENGPEIIDFGSGGAHVFSNAQSQRMVAGAVGSGGSDSDVRKELAEIKQLLGSYLDLPQTTVLRMNEREVGRAVTRRQKIDTAGRGSVG